MTDILYILLYSPVKLTALLFPTRALKKIPHPVFMSGMKAIMIDNLGEERLLRKQTC